VTWAEWLYYVSYIQRALVSIRMDGSSRTRRSRERILRWTCTFANQHNRASLKVTSSCSRFVTLVGISFTNKCRPMNRRRPIVESLWLGQPTKISPPPSQTEYYHNQTRILIASAGSSSKMTAEFGAQSQNSPGALNMPILGTAHSSNPFGGCAMAMRELGQPPSSRGWPGSSALYPGVASCVLGTTAAPAFALLFPPC
jgi:hypothetical protein